MLTRTAGESSILGYDSMKDTYEIRERVGYIAQQNVLPADMTVMENMEFFAGVHSMSREDQKRRIPELLAVLRDDPELRFEMLADVTGVDYAKEAPNLGVMSV